MTRKRCMDTWHIVMLGMITTVAFGLSFLESVITLPFLIPGMKLGLANIAVLYALFAFDVRSAVLIALAKLILSSILFGNPVSVMCSVAGTFFALIVSILLYRMNQVRVVLISTCAAVAHNIGQLVIISFVIDMNLIMGYMPVLIVEGCVAGILIGCVARFVLNYSFDNEKRR